MDVVHCEQGSDEWHQRRAGIVTMSNVACLLVNGKSATGLGAGAYTYLYKLVGERITGEPSESWEGNEHTERGKALEPEALDLYCAQQGVNDADREAVGVILNHGAGFSPDLLVGPDGSAEVKTKLPKFMVPLLLTGEVPKEHLPQCQGGLWVSEREWIDFVAYWPGMPLFVKRVFRDEEMIARISERVELFNAEIDRVVNKLGVM